MPTYEALARFERDLRRLARGARAAFLAMLPLFIAALRASPPDFPPSLRVKRVQGTDGIWEITFAADGRATFEYGPEIDQGSPHVIWRRVGTHDVLREP